ncbi:MAG: hypothetical protein AB1782_03230 [Cyanobacteriota bacterium]
MVKNSGSSITQYSIVIGIAIILIAIAFSGLGQNLVRIFTGYSDKYESISEIASSNLSQLSSLVNSGTDNNTTPETSAGSSPQTINANGTEVTINADGSASFKVSGQGISLSREILELQDIAMETSGSAGSVDLVTEIAYMIEKYKDEYPQDVPVDIFFGNGVRLDMNSTSVYTGLAEVNNVAVKVGDHIVVLNNDQTCNNTACNYQGNYRLEGDIDTNNNFQANVTSNLKNSADTVTGNYTATVDLSNGLIFTGASKLLSSTDNTTADYNWDLNFTDTSKQFSIK